MSRKLGIDEFAENLAEGTRQAITKPDLETALPLVISLATDSAIADFAGVTQRIGKDKFLTIGATDPIVEAADILQYELNEGPCVDATYEDGSQFSPRIDQDPRWPKWGPAAYDLGIRSVLSVHLYTEDAAMGALNLYSRRARDYTSEDLSLAQLVGTHASVAIAHFRGTQHLWKAIDARHRIGVAQGILRHEYNINAEQALSLLIRVSQNKNIKLHQLAEDVIQANTGAVLNQ